MTGTHGRPHNLDCGACRTCLKRLFPDRTTARRAARAVHPGAHLSPYRCPGGAGWHYGHLPSAVRRGEVAR